MVAMPPLTLGIEEEYQIIDPTTGNLSPSINKFIVEQDLIEGVAIKPEFMRSQVEVGSRVCKNSAEIRAELIRLRRAVCQRADAHGLTIAAASTHPFARWADQEINDEIRYQEMLESMQGVVRQLLIFGTHVHVGFGHHENPAIRDTMIEIMTQARYFIPHLLALSTSSPFWQGNVTGLKSYRSVVFEMLPRTGIPPMLKSWDEYKQYEDTLTNVGAFGSRDQTAKIWWDIRPHPLFDTLEFRISDVCTTVDEAVCITALFQAICAKLLKLRQQNLSWRSYRNMHISENKWRAVRYGISESLIDFGRKEAIPFTQLATEILAFIDDVVDELGCRQDVEYLHQIIANGTSADRQLAVYHAHGGDANRDESLSAVVTHLIKETRKGVF